MVDITKDEFWENKHEEVSKKRKKESKLKSIIKNHKWIMLLILSFLLLTISNGLLVYNFFKVITKL